LAGLVSAELQRDLHGGDLFLFVNRRRNSARVLLWDGTGLCLYAKKLARGQFACLWTADRPGRPLRLTTAELNLYLQGIYQHRASKSKTRS
jgi:transposase